MGKLVRLPGLDSSRAASIEASTSPLSDREWELGPVLGLLFLASLARVIRALWVHEPFETEPTFALCFVVVLPWLLLRRLSKRV